MLPNRILFVLYFLLSFTFVKAQDKTEFSLHTLPLNFLNPNMPHLTIGGELIIANKIGIDCSYGRRVLDEGIYWSLFDFSDTDNFGYYDSLIVPSYGKRFHLEIKYYYKRIHLERKESFARLYAGLRYIQLRDIRNKEITYHVPDDYSDNSVFASIDTAIDKKLHIVNFIYGAVIQLKRFEIDPYILVGLKKKKQYFINNEYHEKGWTSNLDHYSWDDPMNKIRPSFNVGLKIGFALF